MSEDCEEGEQKMGGHAVTNQKPPNGTELVKLWVEPNESNFNSAPLETREKSVDENKPELVKKDNTHILITLIVILSVLLLISLTGNVVQYYKSEPKSVCSTSNQSPPCVAPYLQGWDGLEQWCYYLSTTEATWNESQSNCSSYGGSLTAIDTQNEMDFLLKKKDTTDYWIGLWREGEQPWKWANGTDFNHWFRIGADGHCAYLIDRSVSSSWCGNEAKRNWICRRSHLSA